MFHVPYVVALAWAYRHGDFSLAYPIARGGGALLAAIGGVVMLGDDLSPLSIAAILVVVSGMALLAWGAEPAQVAAALVVACSIGGYTLFDSHAAREYGKFKYVFASQVVTATTATVTGLALRRGRRSVRTPAAGVGADGGRSGDDDRRLRARARRRSPRTGRLRGRARASRAC